MKILILGINYAPEPIGIGPYTAGWAEALAAAGHEVFVVTAKPYYPHWRTAPEFVGGGVQRSVENGVHITRAPIYVPAKPSGLRRLIHHFSFAVRALMPMLAHAHRQRPDVVLTIAPSLIATPVARIAAKLCDARTWLHVQDFEVEAAFATGLLKEKGFLARVAEYYERRMLRVDRVSSISPQMCHRLIEKGVAPDQILELRNWANVNSIQPLTATSPYRAEWAIERTHVALYSGNIANKQGIDIIVKAAELLVDRKDLLFIICGNGASKEELMATAAGLDNVRFFDLQPEERLSDMLGLATMHLLPQIAGAADLVLPSKMANMLASGRPIVATAEPGTGLADEVEGSGIVVPPGDAAAFATAIVALLDAPARRAAYGEEARRRAEERWSRDHILNRMEQALRHFAD